MRFVKDGITYRSQDIQIFDWYDDFTRIEYWHNEDFIVQDGQGLIRYTFPYKSRVFLKAPVAQPQYPNEADVEDREGIPFELQQVSYKQWFVKPLITEYQADALRIIQMHDNIRVYYLSREHQALHMNMDNPEWTERANIAHVTIEYRTNPIVVVNGRGLEDVAYEETPGTCVATAYSVVAKISNPSDDFTNFTYTDANGNTVDMEDGDLFLVDSGGGSVKVNLYNDPGSLTPQSLSAQDVVYQQVGDLYYTGVGSNNALLPAINFYDSGTQQVSGVFMPGALHTIYSVVGGSASIIGTYTYQQLAVDGVAINVPPGSEFLRMELSSIACGIFQESVDYEIQIQTGDQPLIGNFFIGQDIIGIN